MGMSYLLKLDRRGRLTLPAEVRDGLKIGSLVLLKECEGKLEIIPIADPLEKLRGSSKVSILAEELDELSESMVLQESLR